MLVIFPYHFPTFPVIPKTVESGGRHLFTLVPQRAQFFGSLIGFNMLAIASSFSPLDQLGSLPFPVIIFPASQRVCASKYQGTVMHEKYNPEWQRQLDHIEIQHLWPRSGKPWADTSTRQECQSTGALGNANDQSTWSMRIDKGFLKERTLTCR